VLTLEFALSPIHPPPDQPAQLPGFIPLIFVVMGLIFGYFAFFRRVYRLEVAGDTLFWFLPFHRLVGQSPIADIASIQKGYSFQWSTTTTLLTLRDSRTITIRNRAGIRTFVTGLRGVSPDISVGDWYSRKPFDNPTSAESFDTPNGD
jgi:hypothetical protein